MNETGKPLTLTKKQLRHIANNKRGIERRMALQLLDLMQQFEMLNRNNEPKSPLDSGDNRQELK